MFKESIIECARSIFSSHPIRDPRNQDDVIDDTETGKHGKHAKSKKKTKDSGSRFETRPNRSFAQLRR